MIKTQTQSHSNTQEAVLELKQISHVYVNEKGASLAVEQIDLAVARGEFVSLVGPSGCGKTTLLSLLAGLFSPTKGKVLLNGEPVHGPTPKLGYMLQQDYLFPWRTIRDNAAVGIEINRRKTKESMLEVDRWLTELGLENYKDRYPYELSGGMRQRVALVRTLVTQPEVLLLDEPFSALDMQIKLQLEDLVHTTLKRLGKTVVLVTHDLAEAAAMSDRVIVLGRNPGRIQCELRMPDSIRTVDPMSARKHASFNMIFEQLWAELDRAGDERGEADG